MSIFAASRALVPYPVSFTEEPVRAPALQIGPLSIPHDVLLAPLSGITDVPFRRLARRFGAGLVFSEMVASGELLRGSAESFRRAMADGEGLHAVQLAGRCPLDMGTAARRLADAGADLIDINLGCPAKKVVGGLSGSALMREPDLALRIIEATVAGAGDVPVSVKMRLGWDRKTINAPVIAARAEAAGVRMITVHGRTRDQFYEGSADWGAIAAVKAAVSVPVVANGDLVDAGQERRMRGASGADALMAGRGAQGRPWFPGALAGAASDRDLEAVQLADLACEHLEMMLEHYGGIGLRHARKHLGWYCDRAAAAGAPAALFRREILSGDAAPSVSATLRAAFAGLSLLDVERATTIPLREAA